HIAVACVEFNNVNQLLGGCSHIASDRTLDSRRHKMSTTRKKSRIGGTNNRTVHAVGRYAHQPNGMMRMMRKNYDGIAKSARQRYRRANTMARRHPQASL